MPDNTQPKPPSGGSKTPSPNLSSVGTSARTQASPSDILVIHGPNLNMLGTREPELYGDTTLEEVNNMLSHIAERHHIKLHTFQSNHEGAMVDRIQEAIQDIEGIIINPGGFTHTSVAIRDALVIYPHPIIEVHMTNIYARESFRKESMMSAIVDGTITGFGVDSYRLALLWMIKYLD